MLENLALLPFDTLLKWLVIVGGCQSISSPRKSDDYLSKVVFPVAPNIYGDGR
jgi:hypothetical protein